MNKKQNGLEQSKMNYRKKYSELEKKVPTDHSSPNQWMNYLELTYTFNPSTATLRV